MLYLTDFSKLERFIFKKVIVILFVNVKIEMHANVICIQEYIFNYTIHIF